MGVLREGGIAVNGAGLGFDGDEGGDGDGACAGVGRVAVAVAAVAVGGGDAAVVVVCSRRGIFLPFPLTTRHHYIPGGRGRGGGVEGDGALIRERQGGDREGLQLCIRVGQREHTALGTEGGEDTGL